MEAKVNYVGSYESQFVRELHFVEGAQAEMAALLAAFPSQFVRELHFVEGDTV